MSNDFVAMDALDQLDARPANPVDERAANGTATDACSECGSTEPAVNGRCPTPTCRCFRKSNRAAATAGGYRGKPTADDQRRSDQLLSDVQSDPLATTLREWERDYAAKRVLCDILAKFLTAAGPLTEAGRRRAALDAFLSVSESTQRTAQAIRNARTDATTGGGTIDARGLRDVPTAQLQQAIDLMERQAAGATLTDFEQGQLSMIAHLIDGRSHE